jgi:hypothetical protein
MNPRRRRNNRLAREGRAHWQIREAEQREQQVRAQQRRQELEELLRQALVTKFREYVSRRESRREIRGFEVAEAVRKMTRSLLEGLDPAVRSPRITVADDLRSIRVEFG